MANLAGVVLQLRKEHDRLTKQIRGVTAALAAFGAAYGKPTGTRRKISAAGRARIAAAQRARWAKVKNGRPTAKGVARQKKRTLSAAARKKIAAAQKARWAKVRELKAA
jgi:hypothetical protein